MNGRQSVARIVAVRHGTRHGVGRESLTVLRYYSHVCGVLVRSRRIDQAIDGRAVPVLAMSLQ